VRIIASFAFTVGIINLVSAVQPALPGRLALIEECIPLEVRHGSRITSTLAGSLWRRKRAAWAAAAALLLLTRDSFQAASDRPSQRQGLVVLAAAFCFTLLYGTAGFYLLDRHFSVRFNLLDALRQTATMFASFNDPGLTPLTPFGKYFSASIYIIGLPTLSFALLMLIRPVLVRQPATSTERKRAQQIVQQHGPTALARAALFDDKYYLFTPSETVISYGARGRGALALGDPIGPPGQVGDAILAFGNFCANNDWSPAFVSVLPDHLGAYRAAEPDSRSRPSHVQARGYSNEYTPAPVSTCTSAPA
jgi:phosphatidylglycerol lysyltransferase